MSVDLFISCVSDEFARYRDPLRVALTRHDVAVKIQEDFKSLGGDTLRKLEDYIERCSAVVHFVGEMTGSAPPAINVEALLARRPQLKAKMPPLARALDADEAISYTHWEAWLALYFGCDLEIMRPAETVAPSPTFAPTDASRTSQTAHLARLKEMGCHPSAPFASEDNLVAQIYSTSVLSALVEAEKAGKVRRPNNLPFATLGPLFKGREKFLDDLRAALSRKGQAAVVGRALHGLGGVGKTRLAIEYAWRHAGDYSALLFVGADSPEKLNADLGGASGAGRSRSAGKGEAARRSENRRRARLVGGASDLVDDPRQRRRFQSRRPHRQATRAAERRPRDRHRARVGISRASAHARTRHARLGRRNGIPARTHGRGSAPRRPTTRPRRANSPTNSTGSRSGSNKRAPILRASASALHAI